MKVHIVSLVALIAGALALLNPWPTSAADPGPSSETLTTEVSLLIGRPGDGEGSQGVLVVPGAVIPAQSDGRLDTVLNGPGGEEAARRLVRNTRLRQVAGNLKASLRLGEVEVRYQTRLDLGLEQKHDLPAPASSSSIRLSVELLGFNASSATYRVRFHEGSRVITDTPLTIERGKQAVVGGLDGEEAPYLFLVIAPAGQGEVRANLGPDPVRVQGDVQPPIAIKKPGPPYTTQAKEAGIEGIVIVHAIVETDGTVSEVKVLKGLSHGLTESAVETIQQWVFEPALLGGQPISVYHALTVNFRLDEGEEEG